MPVIMIFRNVRIVMRLRDHNPPHIHAIRGDSEVVINIVTGEVMSSQGFSRADVARIVLLIDSKKEHLMQLWREYHE